MSDPIFVSIPQPPQKQRIVRVPDDALLRGLAAKGGVERMYLKKDTEVHDVTPEEMGSAGWVPQSALDTQVEATLSNIRRAGHFDREREEARDTIARAWEHITDSPVGVRTLDVEIARLVRERDKARAERDEARRERDEEIGLQKAELNDATLERDKVRTETPEPRRQQGPAAKVQSGWALPARLELDELERTVSVARGVLGAEPTEGIVQAAEKAIRERDDSVKRLEALTSTLVKLFEWDEDPSFLHAATHIENAVMNLRTNLSVTTRDRDRLAEMIQAAHLVLGSPFGTSILDSVRCAVTQREEALCKVARVEKERDEARDTIARARGCITNVPAGVRNALDVEVARVVRERDEARDTIARAWDKLAEERESIRTFLRERDEVRLELARVESERDRLMEAAIWMSGSPDFSPGGQAHEAFARDVAPLLRGSPRAASVPETGTGAVTEAQLCAQSDFDAGAEAERSRIVASVREESRCLRLSWPTIADAMLALANRLARGEYAGAPVPAAEPRATDRPSCNVPGCAARIRWTVLGPGPSWVHYCDEHRPPRETPVQAAEAPMPRATDEELGSVARRAFPHRVNEDSDVSIEDLEKVALAVAARVRREQPAHAELDAAWAAAQVPVRGLTTLADVITTLRERPAVCLVTRAVEAGCDVEVTEHATHEGPGWYLEVRSGEPVRSRSHSNVPPADVPKTLARLIGEVTRGR